ncbi:MAG TPA: C40 family peptidase [Acidimicrobiales bacterium]|nr:C40 family peptidase [Acidimicrobiales bacterium]
MTADPAFIRRAFISAALSLGYIVLGAGPAAASSASPALHEVPLVRAAAASGAYWVVDRGGGVGSVGGAPVLGALPRSARLEGPIVAVAATPDGRGYWLASATGGIYSFGDAGFYGAFGTRHAAHLPAPIVAMAATRDGRGYWLASSAGAVYKFGDARYFGSHAEGTSGPIVAMAGTPEGGGYWLVSSSGHVYCFGDARCAGSASSTVANNVVGFAPTPDGRGYWLATSRGEVLALGDARAVGAPAHVAPGATFVGFAAARGGRGYWLVDSSGNTYGFGSASHTSARLVARHAVAVVADPAAVVPRVSVAAVPGARVAQTEAYQLAQRAGEIAADFALSQVGKPYIWGGIGPYGYDCSGLALASWQAAGVYLPRTAAEQYYAGSHVPLSQVQPGDLIFWASDPSDPTTIYHVGISLGGQRTVQATHTGSDVEVVNMWSQDLVPEATVP